MALRRSGVTGACPMVESTNASANVSASAETISLDLFIGALHFSVLYYTVLHFFVWSLLLANQKLSLAANWKARGPPVPKIGLTRLLGCPKVNSFWVGGRPGVPCGLV